MHQQRLCSVANIRHDSNNEIDIYHIVKERKSCRKMKSYIVERKSEWLVRTLAQIGQARRGGSAPSPLGVGIGSRSRLPADDMSDLCIPSIPTQTTEQRDTIQTATHQPSGLLEHRLFALRYVDKGSSEPTKSP